MLWICGFRNRFKFSVGGPLLPFIAPIHCSHSLLPFIAPIHCSHFIGPKGQPYVSPVQRAGCQSPLCTVAPTGQP